MHKIHAYKPPATKYNFPTSVVETEAAKRQPPPTSTHKQPTTDDRRVANEPPMPPGAGPKTSQQDKFLQVDLSTKPENQYVRARAAHAVKQVVTMYLATARPHHYTKRPPERQQDQQDHTTAGRRESRRRPHIYIGKRGASPS